MITFSGVGRNRNVTVLHRMYLRLLETLNFLNIAAFLMLHERKKNIIYNLSLSRRKPFKLIQKLFNSVVTLIKI